MEYRVVGRTGVRVSSLCLGTMTFGGEASEAESARIFEASVAAGVNFVDTADVYSKGGSEQMLGALLQGQRDDWIVATKLGNQMSERPNERGYSRAWVQRACEASLRRLATDHIDLYYLHRDYDGMDLEEPLRAIDSLLAAGKIRYWGLSNFRAWRISEAVHLARAINMPPPLACQPYYNLLNRQPETELLPACAHHGLGVVPYSPVARGVLSGKYAPGAEPAPGTRAGRGDKRMMETEFRDESLRVAQTLRAHCERKGVSLVHFATAWVLAHHAVSAVIAGPRTLAQWRDYLGALDCALDAEDEALVDSLVAPGHPSTPGYNDPVYPLAARRRA